MDTVEFFKTANRLCKDQGCKKCPACKEGMCMVMRMIRLDENSVKSIEETISKVEQWEKDHQIKTRKSEMQKIFPDVRIVSGAIYLCPRYFLPKEARDEYCKKHETCEECRKDYWLTEVPDND